MKRHAKALSSGPTEDRPLGLARIFGVFSMRGVSGEVPGSGATSARLSRRRLIIPCVVAALMTVVALTGGATVAFAAGPPHIEFYNHTEDVTPFATRVALEGQIASNGSETTVGMEYATSPSGPWTSAGSQKVPINEIDNDPAAFIIRHLTPETTYYARMTAENASGTATPRTAEFTTTAVGAPEIAPTFEGGTGVPSSFGREDIEEVKIGTTFASFRTVVEADGAETEYHLEYATSESGPYALVPGGSGSITPAGEFAVAEGHLEGLSPETAYYIRVKATNNKGTVIVTRLGCQYYCTPGQIKGEFQTRSVRPQAYANEVVNVTETSAHVVGSVDPATYETNWRFEYSTSPGGPWIPVPGGSGTIPTLEADEAFHHVNADLAGLKPSTTYYVRLFAKNINGTFTSNPESFATASQPTPPTVETNSYHVVHGEVMRVLGSVNPNGSPAVSHFEYVVQEQFEKEGGEGGFAKAESTPLLPGSGPVGIDLPGLQPGKTYHFRLVATNGNGTGYGADETLTVPVRPGSFGEGEGAACPNEQFRTGLSAHLPDCRAYEQVTPVDKEGAVEINAYGLTFSELGTVVGEDGDHMLVVAPATHWGSGQSPYVFSRGPVGWQMTAATAQPEAGISHYQPALFSPDLTGIGVEASWLTSGANQSRDIEFKVGPPGGPYITVASVPRSQVGIAGSGWVAASEDFSKLILRVQDHTLLGHATGTTSGSDLYEYSEDALRQVNVQSNGEKISTCGATMAMGADELTFANNHGSTPHAVSVDGSRVFFTDDCTHHLYIRVHGVETVDVGAYVFLAADAQGSRLLLENGAHERFLYETETGSMKHLVSPGEQSSVEESFGIIGRYSYFEANEYKGFVAAGGSTQLWRVDNAEKAVECVSCASPFDPEPKWPVNVLKQGSDGLGFTTHDGTPTEHFESTDGNYAFFETSSALVSQDQNGEIEASASFGGAPSNDVYEWRKAGVDGCAHIQGCVSLISSGTAGYLVGLLGTTASGHDVFFTTHSQLLPQDKDTAADVYDARVGGGFPTVTPMVECEGDVCSTPARPPNDATPSSFTFMGAGNLLTPSTVPVKTKVTGKAVKCSKGKALAHGKCVKKKSRGKKKSKAKSHKGGK